MSFSSKRLTSLLLGVLGFLSILTIFLLFQNNRKPGENEQLIITPTITTVINEPTPTADARAVAEMAITTAKEAKQTTYKVGDTAEFKIIVDTHGADVIAVDSKILLPSNLIEFISVTPGKAFTEYPLKVSNTGMLMLSGIMKSGEKITGSADFASFAVKFTKPGKGQFRIQYSPTATNDSNIVGVGKDYDLLGKVTDFNFEILLSFFMIFMNFSDCNQSSLNTQYRSNRMYS